MAVARREPLTSADGAIASIPLGRSCAPLRLSFPKSFGYSRPPDSCQLQAGLGRSECAVHMLQMRLSLLPVKTD